MVELICIDCPNGCQLKVEKESGEFIVTGNLCKKGIDYAKNEISDPKRTITSTVKTAFSKMPRLPVRTDGEIPKKFIFLLMELINKVILNTPVHNGDIIIKNVLDTGVNVIATSDMFYLLNGE